MRVLARLGIGAFVVLALLPVSAQQTPEKYLELLRSDVRSQKVAVLTEALELPQAQADVFWPIYREYDKELQGLGDRRVTLVKRFAEKYGTLTDADADGFVKEWFDLQNDRIKLRQKYYSKISKATTSLVAARFLQVENTLEMLIDLNIAAELPLLK